MSDFVEYSRGLMEAAKGFRTQALQLSDGEIRQALLRASLLHACSFLEAHLNYLAEHFKESAMFSVHEKGVLLEREIKFESGTFRLSEGLKISRITDRVDLLLSKCSDDPANDRKLWYGELRQVLQIRNSLVHPKETHRLTLSNIDLALDCVLKAADTLYSVVFKKPLPYAKKGIEGGLALY